MEDILIGTTDRTITVFIPDPSSLDGSGKTALTHSDLTVSYTRVETDNDVVVTDVTSSLSTLTNLTDAHADWGLKEVSSTLAPGLYRLDIADAVFASGAWEAVVYVMITSSAAAASPKKFRLVSYNALDSVRLGLTALPNAAADAAGGLPISDAGGLDLDARLDAAISSRQVALWAAASSTVSLTNTTIANVSAVTSVAALGTGAITAASFATDAIDADALATDAVNEIRNAITGGAYDLDTDANGRIRVVDGTAAGEINTASGVAQAALADGVTHGGTTADFLARDISIGGDLNVVGSVVLDNAGNDIRGIQVNGLTTAGLNAIFNHVATGNVTNSTLGAIVNDLEDGGRLDAILDARASQTSVDDIPTNAELATALGTADDAVLAAIAALNNISSASVTAAVWHADVAANDNTVGSFGDFFGQTYTAATVDIQTQITALNDLDAAGIRAAVGLASANLDTQLDALPTANEVRNAVTGGAYALDTDANGRVRIVDGTGVGEIDTSGGAIASVLALGTQAKADVNAEVVDCLNVDTYAQASQGTPPATASIAANITMLAKFARNKRTQASGYVNIFNDDATTVDHKSAVSDDGTTFTAGEFATGP